MYVICFLTALFACIIGKICGMGGGVIIKPVLDAAGIMSVADINFLSGLTVIGMTCWSVGKSTIKKESVIELSLTTPLAIGAAAGGVLGKAVFSAVSALFNNANSAGGIQAILLLLATFATLLYTLNRSRISSKTIQNKLLCIIIGMLLGMLGAFLGIGGGPFNMAVLFFFFSMSTKTAAQNSLYIILISQTFSIVSTAITSETPSLPIRLVAGMILCGVAGSEIGGRINRRLTEESATRLFEAAMVLVMGISLYNIYVLL